MLDISNYVYLTIEPIYSSKKDKDYYALCVRFKNSDDKIIVKFIYNNDYEIIKSLIEKSK